MTSEVRIYSRSWNGELLRARQECANAFQAEKVVAGLKDHLRKSGFPYVGSMIITKVETK